MNLPDIEFNRIRPVGGSRQAGFEQLCCQLAELETEALGGEFYRKGLGGDSGVECYRQLPDGTQIGWQAKYFSKWKPSLANQLNNSIATALEKHPDLREYYVCLSFDLPDSKSNTNKTALEKWLDWQLKWTKFAEARERPLKITLWGQNELIEILTKDDPLYSGRILYWFNQEAFSSQWFRDQFRISKASLGHRYTPETNVDLPIRTDFSAFARHPDINNEFDDWFFRLSEQGYRALEVLRDLASDTDDLLHRDLGHALEDLRSLLGGSAIGPEQCFPRQPCLDAAYRCSEIAGNALAQIYRQSTQNEADDRQSEYWARQCVHQLLQFLHEIEEALSSNRWKIANENAVLLQGSAGTGKSHLLADIVAHHMAVCGPALILVGAKFVDNELWPQIRDQLDRPPMEQFRHFLGCLDAAAQRAGVRALICIDALNERHGLDIWPTRLPAFLETAKAFPRVGVVVSCRTIFVPSVIPDALVNSHLFRLEHQGFAGTGGDAAKAYLDKRGIVRPGAPQLVPEFDNPLFLKTCCDALARRQETEIPKGLRGVTSIFEFYTDAIVDSLNRRMWLDARLKIVPQAIAAFTKLLVDAGEGRVAYGDAVDAFESLYPSQDHVEKSLLTQLENEGFLTVEPIPQDDQSVLHMVRFTFERFSDHMIASHLLDNHLNPDDVRGSFRSRRPLQNLVFGSQHHHRAGIINALAVQLPERTGVELVELAKRPKFLVLEAFRLSLMSRDSSDFTAHTFRLAQTWLDPRAFNDLLVSVSTEPTNRFNALFLHKRLIEMTMPDRDSRWSVYLARHGYTGPVETLISWALNNAMEFIEHDRAHLAATTLTWFLTTSHREIRDKATKALATILSTRLTLAARLVRDFAPVNDPYVIERLIASCYGAALQGVATSGLAELSQAIFDTVFANASPPPDALLRDHAQRLLEYAELRGELPSAIDIESARPPHQAPWHFEKVTDEIMATYAEKHRRRQVPDQITMSTVHDGDFAHYVIDGLVSMWSPAPLGTDPLPTSPDPDDPAQADSVAYFLDTVGRLPPRLFSVLSARRWVCKKAHDLGWTQALFGQFDRQVTGYRQESNRVERIGKKYQWIALRDLIARMSDNLAFVGGVGASNSDAAPEYQGTRNVRLRDIDPSLLLTRTSFDGWREWGRTWWVPFSPQLPAADPHVRLAWLESDSDIINDPALIEVQDPDTGLGWLALDGYASWSGNGVQHGTKTRQRDTWYRLKCIVVAQEDRDQTLASLGQRILTSPHNFPDISLYSDVFLGEYPWHPDVECAADSTFWARDWDPPTQVFPTVATYTCEEGGYDFSVDRTVSIYVPAPLLISRMKLRLKNGRSPVYVDSSGQTRFSDACLVGAGPSAALVDRDSFTRMLDQNNLSAIWVIAGEKRVFGGTEFARGYGGSLRHTAVYYFDGPDLVRQYFTDRQLPSKTQLKRFFEGQPVPHGIATRSGTRRSAS